MKKARKAEVRGTEWKTVDAAVEVAIATGEEAIFLAGRNLVVKRSEAMRLTEEGVSFAYLCHHEMPDGTRRIVTIPVNEDKSQRRQSMTDAREKGPVDEQVLFDAIRDNFSPEAVAAMAMYLHSPDTKSAEVNRQLRWLSNELVTLVGGNDIFTELANEVGL